MCKANLILYKKRPSYFVRFIVEVFVLNRAVSFAFILTAPCIRLWGVAGPQRVAGRLQDRFSDIQCLMLMLAVIAGSFDHEVAVNDLKNCRPFACRFATRVVTLQCRYIHYVSTVSTYTCCACQQWSFSIYGETHIKTYTVADIPWWEKNGQYK
jgi:lipopolysaccharide biosynthesis regulator YciM